MVNLINYKHLWLLFYCCYLTGISTLPLDVDSLNVLKNETLALKQNISQLNHKMEYIKHRNNDTKDDNISKNSSDLLMTATHYERLPIHLPLATKPRGFNLPKSRTSQQQQDETPQTSAQNYNNNYFSHLPPLDYGPAYYSLSDDSILAKFLSQQSKQFQPRHQAYEAHDAGILGSGDFGILKGGTFYSGEEQSYLNEEGSDFYYGDASNTHIVSSTEGFIQKYTYPEEQFTQFRDFADIGTPADSAFSQYVVVYAAKNSTHGQQTSKPKNIFEQLQEIDKEKALEQKKLRKNHATNSSITKLKLVKTKIMEKKWVQKPSIKLSDDDPLIALS